MCAIDHQLICLLIPDYDNSRNCFISYLLLDKTYLRERSSRSIIGL